MKNIFEEIYYEDTNGSGINWIHSELEELEDWLCGRNVIKADHQVEIVRRLATNVLRNNYSYDANETCEAMLKLLEEKQSFTTEEENSDEEL